MKPLQVKKKEQRTEQACFRCTPWVKKKFVRIKKKYNYSMSDTIE